MELKDSAKVVETPDGKIGIWKFNESCVELQRIFKFTESEEIVFQCIKYEKRKREFLTVRLLLERVLGEKVEIFYASDGKPLLKNKPYLISISHSADLAAVIISEENAGIDVENIHRNTEKASTRFLSEKELTDANNSANPALQRVIYWSAKEAAFKFSVWPEIDFKSQINIDNFELNKEGGIFTGQLTKKLPSTKLAFRYFFYENNVIVYCVEEEEK